MYSGVLHRNQSQKPDLQNLVGKFNATGIQTQKPADTINLNNNISGVNLQQNANDAFNAGQSAQKQMSNLETQTAEIRREARNEIKDQMGVDIAGPRSSADLVNGGNMALAGLGAVAATLATGGFAGLWYTVPAFAAAAMETLDYAQNDRKPGQAPNDQGIMAKTNSPNTGDYGTMKPVGQQQAVDLMADVNTVTDSLNSIAFLKPNPKQMQELQAQNFASSQISNTIKLSQTPEHLSKQRQKGHDNIEDLENTRVITPMFRASGPGMAA